MHPLFLLLAGLLGSASPHPDSLSRSKLVVTGKQAQLELRFQSLSMIEVRPELDLDGDGELSSAECSAGQAWMLDYLSLHWRLVPWGAEPLPAPRLISLGPADDAQAGALPEPQDGPLASRTGFGWLEARLVFEAPVELERFRIESTLFIEESPEHRDMASVAFNGESEFFLPFQAGPFEYEFEPEGHRRPGVFASYFVLGYEHIKGGYDHLAFLLVLIVAVPRLRSLIGLVTAFTLAHSITLTLSVLNVGGLFSGLNGPLVEMGIALSIAYVATDNLLRREARTAWVEAFLFGLLHGLGFAGYLREALGGESLLVTALLGFNLGVEGGQLLVVLAVALVLLLLRRLGLGSAPQPAPAGDQAGEPRLEGYAPAPIRTLVSVAVALLGFYWFFERTGWLG